ncbi:MAG: hypothetical protein HOQ03_14050, partial [Thermoleophilia bacterium]|nr:hypothetical protein [Thermoleophilia bacterium]
MNPDHSIPPLRDLPPARLAERKRHLLAAITSQREREPRLSLPTFALPRPRIPVLAGAGAGVAAGATALVLTLSGGSGAKRSPFLVQAVHGPVWSAAPADVNWGGDSMNESGLCTALSVLFCEGTLTLPAAQAAAPTAVTPTSSMTS